VKVFPNEYKRALIERKERRLEAATETTRAQVATNPEAALAK
jgi:glutamate synthase (NADPH/NADH) large chain